MLRVSRAVLAPSRSVIKSVPKVGDKLKSTDELVSSQEGKERTATALGRGPFIGDTWSMRAIAFSRHTMLKYTQNAHEVQ